MELNPLRKSKEIVEEVVEKIYSELLEAYEIYLKEGLSNKAVLKARTVYESSSALSQFLPRDINFGKFISCLFLIANPKLEGIQPEWKLPTKEEIENYKQKLVSRFWESNEKIITQNEKKLFVIAEKFLSYYSKNRLLEEDIKIYKLCKSINSIKLVRTNILLNIKDYSEKIEKFFYKQYLIDFLSDEKSKELLEELKKIKKFWKKI